MSDATEALLQWRGRAERHWTFFRQWLRSPLRTAALVPSSMYLARAMAGALPAGVERVVELGAGTGAITRGLLERGIRPDRLLIIELSPALHAGLVATFPDSPVLCGDARNLPELLRSVPAFADGYCDAVVSSLGFLAMPPAVAQDILVAAFSCLPAEGVLVQYTYGPTCPVPPALMDSLDLVAERVGFTLRNLPPATVYRIRRHR
jgi:phosphatidylethanolamine/phosphatidyl-N-methylethanolamine N-methyltransferase